MIQAIFLSCALALAPVYFHEPETVREWVEQYHELKVFIERIHPGAEVLITHLEHPPTDVQWERMPFTWKGYGVWIKRHHVYDQRQASA